MFSKLVSTEPCAAVWENRFSSAMRVRVLGAPYGNQSAAAAAAWARTKHEGASSEGSVASDAEALQKGRAAAVGTSLRMEDRSELP